MQTINLTNDVAMPIIGYGTFQTPPSTTATYVSQALKLGYRSIDTAQIYRNESGVGEAIDGSDIEREKLFITTKTQTDGYSETINGIDESLQHLRSDYIDLLLIHWPTSNSLDTYRALEDTLKAGKARAIGLSNFNAEQVEQVLTNSHIHPAVDQIETHLFWQQTKMRPFLQANNIIHESWAPFGEQNAGAMMSLPEIQALAQKYQVTPAQVILRYLSQQQIVIIPKSTNPVHMAANLNSLDFNLTPTEMKSLQQFDRHQSIKDWPVSMRETAY
ncbi:aldo/keto reductase [Agrilactobacillus yilanensis]|uniref:Aldo/keto reductase n=1 Tax=Agrilactobacillus yilanensis TaxID=2485997 RepID=A0ABW4J4T6_9LACO|nr:aldo/keto reductase [Agrilactobacillus yilanensis]